MPAHAAAVACAGADALPCAGPTKVRSRSASAGRCKSAGASSVSVLDSKIASAALTPIIVSMRGGAVLCCAVLAMLKLRMTECMCARWRAVCGSACVSHACPHAGGMRLPRLHP